MGCLLIIVYWNYGGFQSIPIGCFPVVGIPPGPVSDLTSPSRPSRPTVQGHWGFPRHALLALLHVLNPMGSHALGDPDLLRGCLFYGLLAAKKPLPEAG